MEMNAVVADVNHRYMVIFNNDSGDLIVLEWSSGVWVPIEPSDVSLSAASWYQVGNVEDIASLLMEVV